MHDSCECWIISCRLFSGEGLFAQRESVSAPEVACAWSDAALTLLLGKGVGISLLLSGMFKEDVVMVILSATVVLIKVVFSL